MENEINNETSNGTKNVTYTTTTVNIPEEYKPISAWGYFGYELLFSIPCVGFIILCVFALGGTKNVNLKNFARSYFCLLILVVIIVALLLLFGVGIASFTSLARN